MQRTEHKVWNDRHDKQQDTEEDRLFNRQRSEHHRNGQSNSRKKDDAYTRSRCASYRIRMS